jgi:hypothetical protein
LTNSSSPARVRERLEETTLLGHGAGLFAACRGLSFQTQAGFLERCFGARLELGF